MKTVLNVKTDKDLKQKAQNTARKLGLPLSTVVNAYLRDFIQNKEITFSLAPRQMTPKLERLLTRVEKDIKTGKNISGPFATTEEMDKYLNSL